VLPRTLVKGFDRRRLRWLLLGLFAALVVPTSLLVWQAWGQLKWEAFHQYRGSAEELTRRIDARLGELIAGAERRSFEDFSFLLAAGSAASNVVQRSPLSNFPVEPHVPGLVGYFQVDTDGAFSTPLLPAAGVSAAELGIAPDELAGRRALAETVRSVLAENRLVQLRGPGRQAAGLEDAAVPAPASPAESRELERAEAYSQQVFDDLGRRERAVPAAGSAGMALEADAVDRNSSAPKAQRSTVIGKVSDIPLDETLQNRVEQKARGDAAGAYLDAAKAMNEEAPISTFTGESDPFEFRLLDSGHFVLFRNLWRGRERYVQGLLIDADRFIADAVGRAFADAGLGAASSLIVAYEEDVIATYTGGAAGSRYSYAAEDLGGALLYRSRLSAPLNSLELIYSVGELPPGPGSRLLVWLSLVLALVFIGGFTLLYRLGSSQIRLAQQQQDFVSAVSHELKTPLTSIRLYGEMLKEGWTDESRRQTYYEYIHDEAERLSRLIANVLQLASITRNEPQLNLQPVPVRQLMDNVESRIASQVERAGFELRVERSEAAEGTHVTVDADCFLQIVINLVDNALKFSRNAERKIVEIESRTLAGGEFRFSVRDYGPGVPRDQMQKIFQLFYRSESELTRETVGTGIGLAIVHQLTAAMNGRVDLVNAEPGAEFRLLFPAAR
jgi:two-component system, OmpR family, phosphate regulon sensor histidine kinase PhoR